MSQLFNNEQKLNDIIFANRNQAYGAYALRSAYGNTIFKSIALMLLGVVFVFSTAFYFSNKNNPSPNYSDLLVIQDSIYVIPFNKEEDQKPEKLEKEEPTKQEENASTENKVVTVVDSTIEVSKTTTTEIVGPANSSTIVSDLATLPKEDGGKGVKTNSTGIDTTTVNELFLVDSEPQFEGGLKALYKFLSHHLQYPYPASDIGKSGTVYIKFVVDENGKVGRLKVQNPVGYGMDEEALRVVSMIPKFKEPAKIKGRPVKAYYQLPIRFHYQR